MHKKTAPTLNSNTPLFKPLRMAFKKVLEQESIPLEPRLLENLSSIYLPLTDWIAAQHTNKPVIIGINGSQGSGKSTLCKILSTLLENGFNKKVVSLSIDDLYKTRAQRQVLAESIHPLLKTRGVPGTHDIALGIHVLEKLKNNAPVKIPAFDKSTDDRCAEKEWLNIQHNADVILFEGWCVGSIPEEPSQLNSAINSLEEKEDADSRWRQYVNLQLATDYQRLFGLLDRLVMLQIPDFNNVFEWRTLQEEKLKNHANNSANNNLLSADDLNRFIMHFERITRHTLSEMPERADVALALGDDHQIDQIFIK